MIEKLLSRPPNLRLEITHKFVRVLRLDRTLADGRTNPVRNRSHVTGDSQETSTRPRSRKGDERLLRSTPNRRTHVLSSWFGALSGFPESIAARSFRPCRSTVDRANRVDSTITASLPARTQRCGSEPSRLGCMTFHVKRALGLRRRNCSGVSGMPHECFT